MPSGRQQVSRYGTARAPAEAGSERGDVRRRVVSFAWGRGLGHTSRLVAVHRALGDLGWDSLFLVEREQRMIADYGLAQVMIPTDEHSLVGEPLFGLEGLGNPRLARVIVDAVLSADDVVLHDVTIQRELYEQATRLGCKQMLIHRFQRNRPEPGAWVAWHAPNIGRVFLLGEPSREEVWEGIFLQGVPDVLRQPLAEESIWPPRMPQPRIAVTAAGGGHADAEDFLSCALQGIGLLERQEDRPVSVYVVTGPHFRGTFTVPPGLRGSVLITGYVGPRHSIYRDTTVVVAHGGYNTVQELAFTGVPAVVVPGVRDFDDQRKHLDAAADRLNAIVTDATPERIADGLARALRLTVRRQRRPPPRGTWEIARAIAQSAAASATE